MRQFLSNLPHLAKGQQPAKPGMYYRTEPHQVEYWDIVWKPEKVLEIVWTLPVKTGIPNSSLADESVVR